MEAAIAAKQAGKIRYIGFTGHKDPAIHLRMLQVAEKHNFHFDTVQMPVNVMDAHFRSFTKEVLPVAIKQGIGILAMKTFGDNYVLQSKTVEAVEALHYSMNLPVSVIITGIRLQTCSGSGAQRRTHLPALDGNSGCKPCSNALALQLRPADSSPSKPHLTSTVRHRIQNGLDNTLSSRNPME